MPSSAFVSDFPAASALERTTVYYLVWRTRPNHPWHSEELYSRIEAHNRYFSLIQRGIEAYLERRQPATISA